MQGLVKHIYLVFINSSRRQRQQECLVPCFWSQSLDFSESCWPTYHAKLPCILAVTALERANLADLYYFIPNQTISHSSILAVGVDP